MSLNFVMAGTSRLSVMRNGAAVVRAWKIPKPVVLVDTREQRAFPLADNHPNWIGGEKRVKLAAGDYSIEGMQDILSLERKSLADAIGSTMAGRARFIRSCERLAAYRWKAIIIEAKFGLGLKRQEGPEGQEGREGHLRELAHRAERGVGEHRSGRSLSSLRSLQSLLSLPAAYPSKGTDYDRAWLYPEIRWVRETVLVSEVAGGL